jgi:uncharacterized protein YndB with AHSA1/START domain
MKFSSVQDINAPMDFVFDLITDFEAYESYAMRFGASIERTDALGEVQPGLSWNIIGEFRGKSRDVDITLKDYNPKHSLGFEAKTAGFVMPISLELMALTKRQSRLKVTLGATAKTLSSRLILQSAKLARNTLSRRYDVRIKEFANHIENSYMRSMRMA